MKIGGGERENEDSLLGSWLLKVMYYRVLLGSTTSRPRSEDHLTSRLMPPLPQQISCCAAL